MNDCVETYEHLYQYLDRELDPNEILHIDAHLSRCPSCFELKQFESGVIKLVKRECGSDKAPEVLKERLRSISQSGA